MAEVTEKSIIVNGVDKYLVADLKRVYGGVSYQGEEYVFLQFPLCLPMLINTFMYYQTMSPAFGYMAIILVLCLFFVYPSIGRCIEETSEEGE